MDSDILVSRPRAATTMQGATGYLTIDLAALGRNDHKLAAMLAPARTGAGVKADADAAAAAADHVKHASEMLESQSRQLGHEVSDFLGKIRAA